MKVSIIFPVEIGFDTINVKLTAECNYINTGIGSYEYMGSREFNEGETILEVKNIEWARHLYTIRENNTIMVSTDSDACYDAFEAEVKQIIEDNISGNF
jgi:hypothetical protein